MSPRKYGTKKWNEEYSKLTGDGIWNWEDALLTEIGVDQARRGRDFWARLLADQKAYAPESYYVSPLRRCLQTANYTWSELDLPHERPFRPLIKENIREDISEHTCDHRSSREVIQTMFPGWPFEAGFTDEDELWHKDRSETVEELRKRCQTVLNDIWRNDDNTWISITSHSGFIAGMLAVLGHRLFPLGTGQAIPVLIEATSTS
jgi:broad specificity phosphatase PhoE